MALLTAEQIASALEAASYSEPLNAFNAYVVQDVGRREYPSIDVENITGQERIRDVPTSKDKQIYLVHLYYRTTGFGGADEPNVKNLEDEIFTVIDGLQTTDTKIVITESWKREHQTIPTPHIESTLRVTTEEIFSEISGGVKGDNITIKFPTPLDATLKVINLITDRLQATKDVDLEMNAAATKSTEIYSLIHAHGILDVEVVISTTQEPNLDTLIENGDDISITLTKGGVAFVKTANLISRVNSAPRSEIQQTIISMDIKQSY